MQAGVRWVWPSLQYLKLESVFRQACWNVEQVLNRIVFDKARYKWPRQTLQQASLATQSEMHCRKDVIWDQQHRLRAVPQIGAFVLVPVPRDFDVSGTGFSFACGSESGRLFAKIRVLDGVVRKRDGLLRRRVANLPWT